MCVHVGSEIMFFLKVPPEIYWLRNCYAFPNIFLLRLWLVYAIRSFFKNVTNWASFRSLHWRWVWYFLRFTFHLEVYEKCGGKCGTMETMENCWNSTWDCYRNFITSSCTSTHQVDFKTTLLQSQRASSIVMKVWCETLKYVYKILVRTGNNKSFLS